MIVSCPPKSPNSGFTLLEVLIAMSIFAMLALITSGALQQAFRSKAVMFNQLDQTRQFQFTLAILSRDTIQATARAVLGDNMRTFPPFIGQPTYIELTRGGQVNLHLKLKRSTQIRIGYLCENHQLIRRTFMQLDSFSRDKYADEVLLDHLDTCRFAFINNSLQVLPIWRPGAIRLNQQAEPLPKAIQLTTKSNVWGEMVNLFIIPEALYADIKPI